MQLRLRLGVTTVLVTLFLSAAQAEVRLPGFFNDHMVLQRDLPLPIWGWAEPGEPVRVQLGERTASTTANPQGEWKVTLPALPAGGGPLELNVSGKNTLSIKDVLMGEVWLCSGQSNMEWVVSGCVNAAAEIQAANYPGIRQVKIPKRPSPTPQSDVSAPWQVCSPETAGGFTACGYFMARRLHQDLKVPIGLINSSWGGTRIEPWTPPVGFAEVPELKSIETQVALRTPGNPAQQQQLRAYFAQLDEWLTTAKAALEAGRVVEPSPPFPDPLKPLTGHQDPTALYNGMIHPLIPYALRGAIWYQGESNLGEGMLYFHKMQALVGGWRKLWGQGEFPFYYVQIAPYQYGQSNPATLAEFWEAQSAAMQIPHTGMVVTNDIATLNDIHPPNKQDVGLRLALLALHRTYGRQDVVDSGPVFHSLKLDGSQLSVSFDNTAGGLKSRDGQPLTSFEIIGPGTTWTAATAKIDGDTITLSAPGIDHPTAMRFAWHKLAQPNLINGAGLPASAFRAGDVPKPDFLPQIEDARAYQLVYDLDLARLGPTVKYDADHSAAVTAPFDRIAYLLELQSPEGPENFVYVSLDAFTSDARKLGLPTISSQGAFQQRVTGMNVLSNVTGIQTGTGLEGNIEFWPHNYGPQNAANIPGASATVWDFGDARMDPQDGYGCMQVHNFKAQQTLFAINHWVSGSSADIGIGNSSGQTRDWTFAGNAAGYPYKRLRVFVRPKQP